MLHEFTGTLYAQLIHDLEVIQSQEQTLLRRMISSVSKVRSVLQELQDYILHNSFKEISEEIYFFKHIKPKIYAKLIYYSQLYQIENGKPYGSPEILRTYYNDEIAILRHFFKQNQFMYEYYKHNMTELDEVYFARGKEIHTTPLTENLQPIPGFSTNADYLFSKFVAYELLCEELLSRINTCVTGCSPLKEVTEPKPKLTWTGDKVNIAELAYGLYYTGQINGGNCDVSDIIEWLEESLNLQMGSVHRKFIDIRRRKTISYTKFIDQMQEAIQKRIEEDLIYKPNRGIKLQNAPNGIK